MEVSGPLQLHKVEGQGLPKLYAWLSSHLPETWKMWSTVRETMSGRWQGTTFYALGWPDNIVAVGEGPPDEKCPARSYFTKPRTTWAYGVSQADMNTLMTWPGFMDWTERSIFFVVPSIVIDVVLELDVCQRGNNSVPKRLLGSLMVAYPGDVKIWPVPDGLTLRGLDPDLHTDLVNASWALRRDFSQDYVRTLIQTFPSLGLFNSDDKCVAFELVTEFGALGLLYVVPEARGQGLSKVITSHLAHTFFSRNLPAAVIIVNTNGVSLKLHESLGFKVKCTLEILHYTPANDQTPMF